MSTYIRILSRIHYRPLGLTLLWFTLSFLPSPALLAQEKYPYYSAPELLQFDELVELLDVEVPEGKLAEKTHQLLSRPFISNEAYFRGVSPRRPVAAGMGPFLRACLWNIERGFALDHIKLAFTDPDRFAELAEAERESDDRRSLVAETRLLSQADLVILNEVDWGMPRTDYLNVVRELAWSMDMNYAFGVQFIEIDPVHLGVEFFDEKPKEASRYSRVNRELYRGLHGLAVLSRYPIRSAKVVPFQHQPYDWYRENKERGLRIKDATPSALSRAFLRTPDREVRRGGRMMLLVELAVQDLPEGSVSVVATHLENFCKPSDRQKQMEEVLEEIRSIDHPVILAGDLNTTGRDLTPLSFKDRLVEEFTSFNPMVRRGLKFVSGLGWLFDLITTPLDWKRKDTDPTVRSFGLISPNAERKLFDMLETVRFDDGFQFDFRGDEDRTLNGRGGTLANSNQRAVKGFKATHKVARLPGFFSKFKLDWIFVKAYARDARDPRESYRFAPHFPRTLNRLNKSLARDLSDHHPIIVDLPFREPEKERLTELRRQRKEQQALEK